jgi:hypothetical protein
LYNFTQKKPILLQHDSFVQGKQNVFLPEVKTKPQREQYYNQQNYRVAEKRNNSNVRAPKLCRCKNP